MESNGNMVLTMQEKGNKILKLEKIFADMLEILDIDKNDPQVKDTPKRMAKMYINEIFSGLFDSEPLITIFPNTKKYNEMVYLGVVEIKSTCSHHFLPFIGKIHVAYIPGNKIIGISKLARISKWFMKRPQIQEELTKQIADYLENILTPIGLAVFIEASHLCMKMRGVEENNSIMKTSDLRGVFMQAEVRQEFFNMIK